MSLHSVICKILRSRASAHLPMNSCGCRFSRPCLEWRHRIFHSRRWSDCTGQAYTSQDCPWSQWNGLNASKVELENVLSVLAGVIIGGGVGNEGPPWCDWSVNASTRVGYILYVIPWLLYSLWSANHLAPSGHYSHASSSGRCCHGAAGLCPPTFER